MPEVKWAKKSQMLPWVAINPEKPIDFDLKGPLLLRLNLSENGEVEIGYTLGFYLLKKQIFLDHEGTYITGEAVTHYLQIVDIDGSLS